MPLPLLGDPDLGDGSWNAHRLPGLCSDFIHGNLERKFVQTSQDAVKEIIPEHDKWKQLSKGIPSVSIRPCRAQLPFAGHAIADRLQATRKTRTAYHSEAINSIQLHRNIGTLATLTSITTPKKAITMKTLTIIVALTFATLTSHAQEISPAPEFDHFIAMRTRAEVRAELKVALANGWHLSRGDATYAPEQQNFVSTLTRAEVRAEVRAAIARGERLSYGQEGSAELPARQAVAMAAQSAIVVR